LQVQPTHAVIVIARNIFLLFRALENNSNRRWHFNFEMCNNFTDDLRVFTVNTLSGSNLVIA